MYNNKQLLDKVFVISGIIKVEVSVISRGRRLRLITLTDITLHNIVLKKITTNALSQRSQFIFKFCELNIAVRTLDIALGNHALRAQPTDYSLICRLRCFPELTVGF